jgi:hypothetical protein
MATPCHTPMLTAVRRRSFLSSFKWIFFLCRSAAAAQSTSSQLQQLQMQLQVHFKNRPTINV